MTEREKTNEELKAEWEAGRIEGQEAAAPDGFEPEEGEDEFEEVEG